MPLWQIKGQKKIHQNTVSKINMETHKVEAAIEVGNGPHGVITSADSQFIYVTNMFDDTVSVIENATNKVIATVSVGKIPNGITIK